MEPGNLDNNEPGFTKKQIDQPILNSELRDQLSQEEPAAEKVSAGFSLSQFYKANKFYAWAIVVGLAIIAILSFFAFRKQPQPKPTEANVKVSIDAPQTIASGGDVVYRIKVENNDSQKLVNTQLELVYPDGVSYISSVPKAENLSGSLFSLKDLIPGQNVVIIVKAKATGQINDSKKLAAKLTYSLSNFNSTFAKQEEYTIRLVASDVLLELSGPTQTNNSQLIIYNLKYQNNSSDDIKNARIKVSYPEGFSYASAEPQPDQDNNTWNISSLAKGGEGNIQIQGSFKSASPGESKTATAQFLVLGQTGEYFTQSMSSFTTAISSLPLLVTQELDNNNTSGVVNPGDSLTFKVKYQNNTATAATGVNILATIDSKAVDLSSIQADGGQVNNNTILWNASSVSKLESLLPNESGELSFTLQLKNPATRDSSKNLAVVSSIKIKSNEFDTYFPGNELSLKVSSPLSIADGVIFSSGSLPPQVGKPTQYKVVISLTNSTNDYSDGVLTAFIPLGAGGFVDKSFNMAESSKAEYDFSTGKLTWNFGSLAAHTGKFSQSRALEFSVRLNPSLPQVGQSPALVKDIKLSAKDVFTKQTVEQSADNLSTSDLPGDQGYSQGQVIR